MASRWRYGSGELKELAALDGGLSEGFDWLFFKVFYVAGYRCAQPGLRMFVAWLGMIYLWSSYGVPI